MNDNAIIRELQKRAEHKRDQYIGLAQRAIAHNDTTRANVYTQLADLAQDDAQHYASLLLPYTQEFASA